MPMPPARSTIGRSSAAGYRNAPTGALIDSDRAGPDRRVQRVRDEALPLDRESRDSRCTRGGADRVAARVLLAVDANADRDELPGLEFEALGPRQADRLDHRRFVEDRQHRRLDESLGRLRTRRRGCRRRWTLGRWAGYGCGLWRRNRSREFFADDEPGEVHTHAEREPRDRGKDPRQCSQAERDDGQGAHRSRPGASVVPQRGQSQMQRRCERQSRRRT